MNRYVCIHGHFYQPPRENPWLDDVEVQDSAYPHHDWNERISLECYGPNATSRILDAQGHIIDIVNNYSRMSFNFGPTLLSWLECKQPKIYQAILKADKDSQKHFSGHGAALAQVYNHVIMPLACRRDKETQVQWGIADFQSRFQRFPEGMWLAETAVDIETLEILAENGIIFTILAPHQAKQFRLVGEERWHDVAHGHFDVKRPYRCALPSGQSINLFFYDGCISQNVAFTGLLKSGEAFANCLVGSFHEGLHPQLVHIATDGETYGHHHRFGDMALAYGLYHLATHNLAKVTIYGEYLEKFPPQNEVMIRENSSWSCSHGIERWRSDCGCHTGTSDAWSQAWRAPLRASLDWLRDELVTVYESEMACFFKNPWVVRNAYIQVIHNRHKDFIRLFLQERALKTLSHEDMIRVLKLLEMQHHTMLMYTSCAWFFDDISRIETIQNISYAVRAIQLAHDLGTNSLEEEFRARLSEAKSNIAKEGDGAMVFDRYVKPSVLDILRVGAHYAVSSVFFDYPDQTVLHCYTVTREAKNVSVLGKHTLNAGRIRIVSDRTWEEMDVDYAAIHLGDHNVHGGVHRHGDLEHFSCMQRDIKSAFQKNDIVKMICLLDKHFEHGRCSLSYLFSDDQRNIMGHLLQKAACEVEDALRHIFEHHRPMIQATEDMKFPLPQPIRVTAGLLLNLEIQKVLETIPLDFQCLEELVQKMNQWTYELDRVPLNYVANRVMDRMFVTFSTQAKNLKVLEELVRFLQFMEELELELNFWKVQNMYFVLSREFISEEFCKLPYPDYEKKIYVNNLIVLGELIGVKWQPQNHGAFNACKEG